MELLITNPAALTAMFATLIFFLAALLTGTWKYYHIHTSPKAEAPVYVNIAHRAALMYSFAGLLLAVFASLSAFPVVVNVVAVVLPLFFFAFAIVGYVMHGFRNTTENQFLNPPNPKGVFMLMFALIVAETGGFLVLSAGFIVRVLRL
jgi:hypothetical protein